MNKVNRIDITDAELPKKVKKEEYHLPEDVSKEVTGPSKRIEEEIY